MTGENVYTGGTVVREGTLEGNTTSLKGAIQNQSALIFNQVTNGTFEGSIQGIGTLIKRGQGKLQITGDCSQFTGLTVAESGVLNVNGSLGGLIQILNGGLLSGTGFINSINNQGVVSPGNSIGTLHVNSFVNQLSGTYLTQINDQGQASLLEVAGPAVIEGGQLAVQTYPGTYLKGMTWTVIQAAGGLFGQFSTIIQPDQLKLAMVYLPNALILQALGNGINTSCLKGNALKVAEYISQEDVFSSDFMEVFEELNTLSCDPLKRALNQLDPALFEALALTASDTTRMINRTFIDRMRYLRNACDCSCAYQGTGAWIAGTADFIRQNRSQGLQRFTTANEGISIGIDNWIGSSVLTGMGAGYTHSNLHWGHSMGKADINGYYLGAYATRCYKNCYLDATLLAFVDDNRIRRHLHFAAIDRRAKIAIIAMGFHRIWDLAVFGITASF
ncbi:MAG: autotransporter domain-containing protein [Parachlamydiaceae bacterium]|nr:MAG: autotransporter domain-containing protein [Parachlamydiaceae bacterium]